MNKEQRDELIRLAGRYMMTRPADERSSWVRVIDFLLLGENVQEIEHRVSIAEACNRALMEQAEKHRREVVRLRGVQYDKNVQAAESR